MTREWLWAAVGVAAGAALVGGGFLYFESRAKPASAETNQSPVAQASDPSVNKPQFARMQLQAQYAGPLQDTIVQRLRDPVDGTICYIYLPIVVHHTKSGVAGYVEYGANNLGSISCMLPRSALASGSAPQTK